MTLVKNLLFWTGLLLPWASHGTQPVSFDPVLELQALENLEGVRRKAQTQPAEGLGSRKGYELWDAHCFAVEERTRRPTVGQNISMVVGKG